MRLIDADELKKRTYPFPCAIGVEHAVTLRAINDAPTIDAQPVVRGRWIKRQTNDSEAYAACSDCRHLVSYWHKTRYCPNCGAKMDGDAP